MSAEALCKPYADPMRFLSVCSGIEAASTAWEPLGWEACAFSEIEKFPSAVLAHHWPDVPNLGDLTQHANWPSLQPDIVVGGTPCQAFSVAGLRQGLADPRGNLTLVFLGLLARERPRWVVWENVPGVLSDKTGAFGAFLGGLGELGYGFAYRVLDAQFFGVAQRRRRVFVVGYLGDWRRAAAVLFEPESLRGDSPPSREKGQGSTACAASSTYWRGGDQANSELLEDAAGTLNCNKGQQGGILFNVTHTLRGEGFDASEDGSGRGTPLVPVAYRTSGNCGAWATGDKTDALTTGTDPNSHVLAVGVDCYNGTITGDIAATMGTRGSSETASGPLLLQMAVRRLTPTECERLQGFPDGHTAIPWRGKPAEDCPDGPRYKALGNSMAVPVMRWIGERIQAIDNLP